VGEEVGRGVTGADLVSAMESQLRTYDNYVPVSNYSSRRPRDYARESYDYAYQEDYVPVIIRHHCERLLDDPFALVEMPLAVSNVCDLGVPYDRVGGLAVELNLGRIGSVQFVELMRYAPVALFADASYYGQPDFVQYEERNGHKGVRVPLVGRRPSVRVYGGHHGSISTLRRIQTSPTTFHRYAEIL
jgi:hypothetical protein